MQSSIQSQPAKRKRGRPPGTKNKPKPPAPAAETKAVAKLADVSKQVKAINALAEKIEHNERKNDDYIRSIVQLVAEIRQARPNDWKTVVKTDCDKLAKLGRSRRYELLAIADGRKTIEQLRASTTERSREKRKRDKESVAQRTAPATEGNGADPEAAAEARKAEYARMEEKADGVITRLTGLERTDRKVAFLERCEQAIGLATYSGPVDDEVPDAAERVAAAWEQKARELRGRVQDAKAFDNHAARGDGPEAFAKVAIDLDPDLPDSCRRAPKDDDDAAPGQEN